MAQVKLRRVSLANVFVVYFDSACSDIFGRPTEVHFFRSSPRFSPPRHLVFSGVSRPKNRNRRSIIPLWPLLRSTELGLSLSHLRHDDFPPLNVSCCAIANRCRQHCQIVLREAKAPSFFPTCYRQLRQLVSDSRRYIF